MREYKQLIIDILIALAGVALLCGAMILHTDAEGEEFDPPCAGVGRIARIEVETTNYTPETETPENEPYIAPQTMVETEPVPEAELIEVIPAAEPVIETDVDALIVEVASEYGLPWELVRAVCWAESGFDPNAISSTGDYGLMQVSYINHGWLGLTEPLDPRSNLRAGCEILKDALEFCGGDFTRALMCYNRGRAYALAQWRDGIFSTAYTEKVLGKYYEILRGEY